MNMIKTALLLAGVNLSACPANSGTSGPHTPATTPPALVQPPEQSRPDAAQPAPVAQPVAPRAPDPPSGSRSDWNQPPKTEEEELAREDACAEDPQTDVNRCPMYTRERLTRERSTQAAREKARFDEEQAAKKAAEEKCQRTPHCIAPRIIAAICEQENRLRSLQADRAEEEASPDGGADSKQPRGDGEAIRSTEETIRRMKQELLEKGHQKFVASMCQNSTK